jgi:hypothetical protein
MDAWRFSFRAVGCRLQPLAHSKRAGLQSGHHRATNDYL